MATPAFSHEEFEKTRATLIKKIKNELSNPERNFIVSFMTGTPDWSLINNPNLQKLPAIQWKLLNINKMAEDKRAQMTLAIQNYFS